MSGFGEKIKELALELTKIPSVVGSSGEVEIAHAIYRWLNRIEYFKQNPDRHRRR
ncbi:hypothetical protein [Thermoanaerobacterium sp. DL9XJH110]|uniref:hypothetical protein n=1 Tax=Thermoanaerobacterium sp. DL9XJH110 TaxID=3386643 RepID=UPI003BB57B27